MFSPRKLGGMNQRMLGIVAVTMVMLYIVFSSVGGGQEQLLHQREDQIVALRNDIKRMAIFHRKYPPIFVLTFFFTELQKETNEAQKEVQEKQEDIQRCNHDKSTIVVL